MKRIDLKGVLPGGIPAKAHQAEDVAYFISLDGRTTVHPILNNFGKSVLILRTNYGEYVLQKHSVHNYYFGTCNGTKVQVSVKRIIGEIRYWLNNSILPRSFYEI